MKKNNLKQSNLRLPADLWMRAKMYGLKKRLPMQAIVAQALSEFLDRQKPQRASGGGAA